MVQTIEKTQESSKTVSLDEEVLKVFASMPDSLKIEVLHYAEYLLYKNTEGNDSTNLVDVDISEAKMAEKKTLFGCMKGTFVLPLPDDFDEPLEEFAEYM
ncbi:hypothetical protein APA_2493 [Pseudanabaena sp. lw0831]|uniref:type II toxin-antitoxin system VapB family antitoxin n=1 Tax=Pseudanabaena sp. lw0831 TaxID=1357935 RepID=UPI0019151FFA|nr:DUF2281 domain-containing protein [Pseudanabaena sp. lw0831]GBO54546.1 hypothetical protein APA_2493 [Pseudanabaena sp. lw0831]